MYLETKYNKLKYVFLKNFRPLFWKLKISKRSKKDKDSKMIANKENSFIQLSKKVLVASC
jgi:hypothetical protein